MVVELTHLATLYHDDVMDEARCAAVRPVGQRRWGNSLAILVGDYLFRPRRRAGGRARADAVRIQAQTFARLVQGQIAETVGPRDADPVQHHLRVLADKTGSLFATWPGSAGCSLAFRRSTSAVASFAETLGLAFQLSDDLLDISSRFGRFRQDARH